MAQHMNDGPRKADDEPQQAGAESQKMNESQKTNVPQKINEPRWRTLHIYQRYSDFDVYDEDKKTVLYRAWSRGCFNSRIIVCRGTATKPTDTQELVGTFWFKMFSEQLEVLGHPGLKVSMRLLSRKCKIRGDGIDWVWNCFPWCGPPRLRGLDGSRLATITFPTWAWTKLGRLTVMGSLSTKMLDLQVVTGIAMLFLIEQAHSRMATSRARYMGS